MNEQDNEPIDTQRDDDLVRIAMDKVKAPAIALIVVGLLAFGLVGYGVYDYVFHLEQKIEEAKKQVEQANQKNGADPNQAKLANDLVDITFKIYKVAAPITWVSSVIIGLLAVMSGLKLKTLQSPGFVRLGTTLCMIPCISGCLLFLAGLPIGIWTLLTLRNPDVIAGFAVVKRRTSPAQ